MLWFLDHQEAHRQIHKLCLGNNALNDGVVGVLFEGRYATMAICIGLVGTADGEQTVWCFSIPLRYAPSNVSH